MIEQNKAKNPMQQGHQEMIAPVRAINAPLTQQKITTIQNKSILSVSVPKDVTVVGLKRIQPNAYNQQVPDTYQISMSLKDFYDLNTEVDIWDEAKEGQANQGYQREPEPTRSLAFARYTIKGNQSFSNYIFSIRDDDADGNVKIVPLKDQDGNVTSTSQIVIKKECKVWIVDGSHRIRGLKEAKKDIESDAQLMASYEMPVSLTIGQSKKDEVLQFITENKMHKGVATELALHCINDMEESGTELEARGAGLGQHTIYKDAVYTKSSFAILKIMNNDGVESPFFDNGNQKGRLRAPNKSKSAAPHTTVAASAFSSSLKPLMYTSNSVLHNCNEQEVVDVLLKWWRAWATKCPAPFKSYSQKGFDPNDYVIMQNIGIYSLNKLLARIDNYFNLKIRNMTQKNFEDLINIPDLTEADRWLKGTGNWSQFGTNQKSFGMIADKMLRLIGDDNEDVVKRLGGTVPVVNLVP